MREFDITGIRLAEFQGRVFEESVKLNMSTGVFLRRFLYSDFLITLDKNNLSLVSLYPKDALEDIEIQFGPSDYGNNKEDKEVLFWIGYLYRYIAYTREINTRFLMKVLPYKDLIPLYPAYHTQGLEYVISSILEIKRLPNDYFEPNKRLEYIMEGSYINKVINNG